MIKKLFITAAALTALAGNGWTQNASGELEVSGKIVLEEILSDMPGFTRAGPGTVKSSGKDSRARALSAYVGTAVKDGNTVKSGSGGAKIKLINAIWALGEIGADEDAYVLAEVFSSADKTVKLNIKTAMDKIEARGGSLTKKNAGIPDAERLYGHLEPGDIVFRKGYFGLLNSAIKAQTVGHVGIYSGIENGEHMVIEGWLPVRKTTLKHFISDWPYYGNYTTAPAPTPAQRNLILDYASSQLGKAYDFTHGIQKGPLKFDCVGLAEAAYESVGLNPTPDEFESGWGWPLTPTEQYEHTFPNF